MITKSFNDYYYAVRYLESIGNVSSFGKHDNHNPKVFIKRTRYLLDLVGSPDRWLKIIHIAGTSGKGSVSDMIHQQLTIDGFRAGLFTSPYTTTSIEKIKVGNLLISPAEFVSLVEYVKPFIDKSYIESPYGSPSYFEIFFVIALLYFKEQKCEWVVVETGLGGSYDSTNAITNPLVTAVTNIGLDHTEVLGNTLSSIARNKSGIAKKNAIFITAEQRPHLIKIMKNIAIAKGASGFVKIRQSFDYDKQNHLLASGILRAIGLPGLTNNIKVSLPGRFEKVNDRPLVILDGAHNEDKISSVLYKIHKLNYQKLFLIFAIAEDKKASGAITKLVNMSDKIFVTRFINSHRSSASPIKIYKNILSIRPKLNCVINLDPINAAKTAIAEASENDLVLVVGSFYLVGEVRKIWYPEEYILKNRKYN